MLSRRRIILDHTPAIPDMLPKGLRRCETSDYLLSQTFHRRFGDEFRRRDVLLKVAGAAALIMLPIRPARALSGETILEICKGTIDCVVAGLELVETAMKVREHTAGEADAENKKGQSCEGTIVLAIFNEDDALEVSEGRQFSIPRYTSAAFSFKHGPSPQESGDKTFAVVSERFVATADFSVS